VKDLFSAELPDGAREVWDSLLAGALPDEASDPLSGELMGLYGPLAKPQKTPFVIAQLGQSLDGFIATESGASHYVTGPESLVHLHRLRALCDAVIVGWRTVASDDPQLSVRHVKGKNPLRVVIDLEGRLPASHKVFRNQSQESLRLTGANVGSLKDVESVAIGTEDGRADPMAIVDVLQARGCKKILVEGGGAIVSSFFDSGALDRLHLSVAPLLLGSGRRGIARAPAERIEDGLRLAGKQYAMGEDVLFDFDLRQTDAP
jgi:diaminohydroxyphosphoribosylaminopyrimidine deaminase/5-amino-6-(5-phosphoribosylamino)uracil reductase